MFLMGLGALLVLGGVAHCHLAGIAQRPGVLTTSGSRHSGAAAARPGILGARNELAGHSPTRSRYSFVVIGSQFLGIELNRDERR